MVSFSQVISHTWGAVTGTFLKTNPLRAIPGTLTSVLHGFLAIARFMRYKEAIRTRKLEFHALPPMLKLESVYYLGICFERFFLAHTFNANQTKQVNKQKCTKKIDGGRNKRKRNEGIHSESAASQQHVYHMFYCLSRYTFVHPLLRYL